MTVTIIYVNKLESFYFKVITIKVKQARLNSVLAFAASEAKAYMTAVDMQ